MAGDIRSDPALTASAQQAVGPYLRAVRRHALVVIAVTALTVAAAGATIFTLAPKYTTTASILVTPLPEGAAGFVGIGTVVDTGDPARTVQTAAALVDTPNAASLTAQRLGRPWTTRSVQQAVSVAPEGASDVLSIVAVAASPSAAQRVANVFASSAVDYRAGVVQNQVALALKAIEARLAQLQVNNASSAEVTALAASASQLRAVQGTHGEPTLSVSQTAQAGVETGSSRILVLILALVGGFALASVIALALETFSRPVRDREELMALYPIPVLASLPRVAIPRGRRGLPPWDMKPEVFEQLRLLRVQLAMGSVGQVIMVTSAGAGDGKTTVTAGLAAAFAEAGRSVVLIDLDLRKPALEKLLEVDSSTGATPGAPVPVPHLPRLQMLPVPRGNIGKVELVVSRLPQIIEQAKRVADIVLVDTAPVGEVSESLRIAEICDRIVFVVRPRHTDRRRLILARDLLARARREPSGSVIVGMDDGLAHGYESYAYAVEALAGPSNGAVDTALDERDLAFEPPHGTPRGDA